MSHPWAGRRVAMLAGGLSAEREVSFDSAARMGAALRSRGYDVVDVDPGRDAAGQLREAGCDVVFVGLHGTYGEDGCIQGLLEVMGLPYTGSAPLASALAMDKVLSKRVFVAAGIPTPEWWMRSTGDSGQAIHVPLVVKPASEGSSVGVTIVRDAGDLEEALACAAGHGDGRVVCEQFVDGVEVSVGVLDGRALGSVQIVPASGFYDYEAKYLRDDTRYLAPAPLPGPVLDTLHQLAERTHATLGCAGATRVDFMVDEQHRPFVIEINTLPGMTDHSLMPMTARQSGLEFADLVEAILDGARTWHRPGHREGA